MRRIRRHLTFANVASATALFLVLGGTAYAATGGNFILGQPNSASSTTSLTRTGANTAKGLQVTNNSTGAGATALGLNVASGHPPFAVNSGTKVANLNADKLDGLDSTGLVQGRGTLLSNRRVFVPTATKTLLVIPGLGELRATCFSNEAQITWTNTTSSTIDRWQEVNGHWTAGLIVPDGQRIIADSANNAGGTLALGLGNDPGARRIATLDAFAFQSGMNAPCGFQAQGTLWTSG